MAVHHLFNSSGDWIAFRIHINVFDTNGKWIGWLPWYDNDVVSISGEYIGTITEGNRLYHFADKPYRGYPGHPTYPGYPEYPGYPGRVEYSPLPSGAKDARLPKPR